MVLKMHAVYSKIVKKKCTKFRSASIKIGENACALKGFTQQNDFTFSYCTKVTAVELCSQHLMSQNFYSYKEKLSDRVANKVALLV